MTMDRTHMSRVTGRAHRLSRPLQQGTAPAGGRFALLLLVLIFTYLLSAFTSGNWVNATQIVLFLVVAALALRSGRIGRRTARLAVAAAIGGTAVAVTLAITHPSAAGAGVANLWAALVLLGAVVLIVGRVLAQSEVSLQSIFGAVSAYMIIGLMFAAVYNAMNKFDGGTFFAQGRITGSAQTFQYFSFTTLTTLGYGDYTAADSGGQAIAVMEALLGQVFLVTLVARLVSSFRAPVQAGRTVPPRSGRRTPSARRPAAPPRRWDSSRRRKQAGAAPGPATRTSSRARAQPARRSRARPGQ
jgi:hypothetical protein